MRALRSAFFLLAIILWLSRSTSASAQDSLTISGVVVTVGTPRVEVEKALQARFRVELAPSGEWALWEKEARAGLAPKAAPVRPPRIYNSNDPEVREQLGPVDRLDSAKRRRVAQEMTRVDLERFRIESATASTSRQPTNLSDYHLPLGYVRFGEDGRLCQVSKEWNPNSESPADSVRALAAAISNERSQDIAVEASTTSTCFFFFARDRTVCAFAHEDGGVSVLESTRSCGARPK